MKMDRDSPDDGFDDEEDADDTEETMKFDKEITNFILQKARKLMDTITDEKQKIRLQDLIQHYELALHKDDEDLVDEAEDALVDFMEELDGDEED